MNEILKQINEQRDVGNEEKGDPFQDDCGSPSQIHMMSCDVTNYKHRRG